MLIDRKQVAAYDSGTHNQEACERFQEFSDGSTKSLTRTDYCLMRDHLIVEIGLANAHRSGVVVNMTTDEFKSKSMTNEYFRQNYSSEAEGN